MSTSRENKLIQIAFVTGSIIKVTAFTTLVQMDSGITGSYDRSYTALYDTLGPVQKGRIDDFVDDVNTFVNNIEPIVTGGSG